MNPDTGSGERIWKRILAERPDLADLVVDVPAPRPWYARRMSDKPVTHKGRNIIDDILDGTLLVFSILYLALAPQIGLELDDQTMAAIATAGAALRVTVRKILMYIYGERLGVSGGAKDAPAESVAPDASSSED